MTPDQSGVTELVARYRALLQAEQTGPPSPARKVQIENLREQLRRNHATLLAETERQLNAARTPAAKPAEPPQSTPKPKAAAKPASPPPEPPAPPPPRYIDPALGEKLRTLLLGKG